MAIGNLKIESYVPVVRNNEGIYSEYSIETTGTFIGSGGITLGGTSAITLNGTETNFLSAAVAGAVSGTPGTLTPTHKIAVNIQGVGTRYIHVGTVA